jgi:hypothetical protein
MNYVLSVLPKKNLPVREVFLHITHPPSIEGDKIKKECAGAYYVHFMTVFIRRAAVNQFLQMIDS